MMLNGPSAEIRLEIKYAMQKLRAFVVYAVHKILTPW